jgi:hypothetical protein
VPGGRCISCRIWLELFFKQVNSSQGSVCPPWVPRGGSLVGVGMVVGVAFSGTRAGSWLDNLEYMG